jgi:nitrate/nitrite transport system permease protein
MVSAVFHSPLEAAEARAGVAPPTPVAAARGARPRRAARAPARKPPSTGASCAQGAAADRGIALLVGIWALLTMKSSSFPTRRHLRRAVKLFSDPFYSKGPNDQGIGWNILFSLQRVARRLRHGGAVGIPLGFMIGRFDVLNRMVSPLISLLRPVSPLAWLPIGLLVFKAANPAAIWTIFICSIWPMIINTAVGVQRVPSDYLNVARVLNLSEWKIISRILFPAVLPTC